MPKTFGTIPSFMATWLPQPGQKPRSTELPLRPVTLTQRDSAASATAVLGKIVIAA